MTIPRGGPSGEGDPDKRDAPPASWRECEMQSHQLLPALRLTIVPRRCPGSLAESWTLTMR